MARQETVDIWVLADPDWATRDITGYHVEARDGSIGKIDDATLATGTGHVVVDTGPWIFGRKVMLPAGVIDRVDRDDEQVFVSLTKEQIKNSPRFEDDNRNYDGAHRQEVGSYYGRGGAGWSE